MNSSSGKKQRPRSSAPHTHARACTTITVPDFSRPRQEPEVRDDGLEGGGKGEQAALPEHEPGESRVRQNEVVLFSAAGKRRTERIGTERNETDRIGSDRIG